MRTITHVDGIFDQSLAIGKQVEVRWTNSHFMIKCIATVVKINNKSVAVVLDKEVKIENFGTWPIGHRISVPRVGSKGWSVNNGVFAYSLPKVEDTQDRPTPTQETPMKLNPDQLFVIAAVSRKDIAENLNHAMEGIEDRVIPGMIAPDDARLTDEFCQGLADGFNEMEANTYEFSEDCRIQATEDFWLEKAEELLGPFTALPVVEQFDPCL